MEKQGNNDNFKGVEEKARTLFFGQREIYNPYFGKSIVLNSDGFHHLKFSARRERSKSERRLKFSLLPFALEIIRKAGTVQEYRKMLSPLGKRGTDGFVKTKEIEYWGLIAILGQRPMRVRVILRRVGDGNVTFWSVMPHSKIKNGHQKLAGDNIEDE